MFTYGACSPVYDSQRRLNIFSDFSLSTDVLLQFLWNLTRTSGFSSLTMSLIYCTACKYHTKLLTFFILLNSNAKLYNLISALYSLISLHYHPYLCWDTAVRTKIVLPVSNEGGKNLLDIFIVFIIIKYLYQRTYLQVWLALK